MSSAPRESGAVITEANENRPEPRVAVDQYASTDSAVDGERSCQSSETFDFAAAYEHHSLNLSTSLRRMFGDGPPEPSDVTQQAFQKLMERQANEPVHDVKAFLWRTAKNIVISEKRRQTVQRRYEPDVETKFFSGGGVILDPQRVLIAKEQLYKINEVLRHMPAKRRRAFLLNRVEGLNVAEVGRRLGLSRSGALKHILKALAQLDELLTVESITNERDLCDK
ncbi:MAG: sigma-70 family RNA polymerase sigma factor [Pseudomonadota bacterium]